MWIAYKQIALLLQQLDSIATIDCIEIILLSMTAATVTAAEIAMLSYIANCIAIVDSIVTTDCKCYCRNHCNHIAVVGSCKDYCMKTVVLLSIAVLLWMLFQIDLGVI